MQPALAQTSEFPIELSAPSGCIDASAFRARLETRRRSESYDVPLRIAVRITSADDGFVGSVSIAHRDGSVTERAVRASRCEDVADALELVTAVSLGLEGPRAAPPPPPPAAPPTPTPKPPSDEPQPRWRVSAAAYAGVASGVGPQWAFAPSVALGVRRDSPSTFSPALEISGMWAHGTTITTAQGSASLTRLDAALAACPVRFLATTALGIRPCAEFQLGTLAANGSGPTVVGGAESSRPWTALGAFARVEWYATSFLRLDIQAGAAFPLAQQRYYFTPNTTIAETSALTGALAVGGAFAWP